MMGDIQYSLSELYALWAQLGDIPTFNAGDHDYFECDSIEESFLHFPVGTRREDIWHWFEAQNPRFIVGEVMCGLRGNDKHLSDCAI